jgi:hypothetical protein
MIFSGIVLSIVAFGALFREVEWDEEDYDEEEGNNLQIEILRFFLNYEM